MKKCASGLGQEHRADGDVVYPVELVDDTPILGGERRRGARVMQEMNTAKCLALADRAEKMRRIDRISVCGFCKELTAR